MKERSFDPFNVVKLSDFYFSCLNLKCDTAKFLNYNFKLGASDEVWHKKITLTLHFLNIKEISVL